MGRVREGWDARAMDDGKRAFSAIGVFKESFARNGGGFGGGEAAGRKIYTPPFFEFGRGFIDIIEKCARPDSGLVPTGCWDQPGINLICLVLSLLHIYTIFWDQPGINLIC